MRLNKEYMGTVELSPEKPVIAGEFSTWTITFTAGEYGIDDGGSLVIAWKSVSDWDTPQFDEKVEPGFTTVTTTGDCLVKARYNKFVRSFGNSILIDVYRGFIKKGDKITVTLGDTSQGSLGMRAQSFYEREHEFRVFLDPCGTNRYEEMPQRLKVEIVPSYHHEIQAIVPATVKIGEPFEVAVRALDEFGNPTDKYIGDVELTVRGAKANGLPASVHFDGSSSNALKIPGCIIDEAGFWNLQIKDSEHGYLAYSNASKAEAEPEKYLYWGDMHGQTRQTVGTGMLEDYYSFSRDKACIQFTGWQGNDFEVSDETWADIRKFTKKFNEEGKFLVYLGYEWSGTTPQGGDHNVYFLHDNADFYPSSNWTATSVDNKNNANPITELHSKLESRNDVLLIPHIGGRYANLDYFNYAYSSVIEIHSHHGTFEWFALDAMKRHMPVGFIAASDDHTCRVGLSYPLSGHGKSASGAFDVASGFTGVYAESLTKEAVWKALKARHCYASTFDRVYVNTALGNLHMGDAGKANDEELLHLEAAGTYPIEKYEVYDWDKKIFEKDCLTRDKKKIRIRWSGVVYRGRGKSQKWDGVIYIANGKLISAEKYAFDRIDQGIVIKSDKYLKFTSSTSGDYDGFVLEIDGDDNTEIRFSSVAGSASVKYADVLKQGFVKAMGGLNLKLEIEPAFEQIIKENYYEYNKLKADIVLPQSAVVTEGEYKHAYWVKVLQTNGNAAWSSPIFVK